MSKRCQRTVGDEFNVLRHQVAVHSDEVTREGLANEFALNLHCATDDIVDYIFWELMLQHAIQHAGKLSVQPLISRDEFVGESEARHQPALLQPVNSAEGAAKKNAFHSRE